MKPLKTFVLLTLTIMPLHLAHAGEIASPDTVETTAPVAPNPNLNADFEESHIMPDGTLDEESCTECIAPQSVRIQVGFKPRPTMNWYNVKQYMRRSGLVKEDVFVKLNSPRCFDSAHSGPCLKAAGFCPVPSRTRWDVQKIPVHTVVVYEGGRHGNTVIKIEKDKYFDFGLHSALPRAGRGQKLASAWAPCGEVRKPAKKVIVLKTLPARYSLK